MKEEKYTCDICHEEHDVSELTYFDESYLCEACLRRETFICRDCGDRHWNDDSADGDLCQTCYDEIMSDVKDVMRLYTMMMLVIMKMKNIMTTRIAESVLTWTR